MFRGNHFQIAGKTAIMAALLSGSSMAVAQEVASPTMQPVEATAQPAPVQQAPAAQPTVAPPPVVRTLPTENDRVNPVAAEQAAAETSAKREAAPKTKTIATPARASSRPAAAPTVAAAPVAEPVVVNEPSAMTDPLPTEDLATVEDSAAIAPVAEPAVDQTTGLGNEDWTIAGGIAAILAALGLGALATRRRRRASNDNQVEPVKVVPTVAPDYQAPRPIMTPIKDDPVFQQMPARAPVAETVIQRRPVMTRPDVPITDPLFSRPVSAPPITDPMFAPRNDVEPPITDPLFAKHDRYVGRSRPAEPITRREPELEPAE